jgi:antitoxin component HigA of HigAB toxin-antitoxin module
MGAQRTTSAKANARQKLKNLKTSTKTRHKRSQHARYSMNAELASTTGLDVLKHLLEANDLNASDLGRILGQRELGSKILRGGRQISRSHAKALGKRFALPAETFLR